MDRKIGQVGWRVVAEVQQRLHEDLDRAWDLEELGKVAGYDGFHFAHLFADVVGEPPVHYLRRLRLERAAHELVNQPDVTFAGAATRAGYGSLEAFSRSFKRAFGVSPRAFQRAAVERAGASERAPEWKHDLDHSAFPAGLARRPAIERVGPLHGWTVVTPTFDDLQQVAQAMMPLLEAAPPDGPWQVGGIAQPWGWEADTRRDLRVFRLVEPGAAPPPPFRPWRLPRGWFARFDFEGPPRAMAAACAWIMGAWIPRSGLRAAFAPLFTLLQGDLSPDHAVARIHAPVEPMTVGAHSVGG